MMMNNQTNKKSSLSCGVARQGNQKSVSFRQYVSVRQTMSLDDYQSSEIDATWYSPEEVASIRLACRREIKRLEAGKAFDNKKYCSRGLEGFTKYGKATKLQIRSEATEAVLDEQELQYFEGVTNESTIAKVYQAIAAVSKFRAHVTSLLDQHDVQNELLRSSASPISDDKTTTLSFSMNYRLDIVFYKKLPN